MTAANQHIVTAYEELGLTPEEIAEADGFEVLAVKAILNQCSLKYRQATKQKVDGDFTPDDEVLFRDVIRNTAAYGEDEGLRLRAAIYGREDQKGRRDIRKDLRAMNFSIGVLNQHLQQAMAAINNVRQKALKNSSPTEAVVDV